MAKMTAIETLLDWLGKNHYYIGNDLLEKVEELKEIEKQQIVNAYKIGNEEDIYYNPLKTGEEYYNETFKTE